MTMKREFFQKFGYHDFMLIKDYIDILYLDKNLTSDNELNKIEEYFYKLKFIYDVIYNYNPYIQNIPLLKNELLDILELLFIEFAYETYIKIEKILSSLTEDLGYNPTFIELLIFLQQKKLLAKKILSKLKKEY